MLFSRGGLVVQEVKGRLVPATPFAAAYHSWAQFAGMPSTPPAEMILRSVADIPRRFRGKIAPAILEHFSRERRKS
ncbi:MAG: hypothetical protein EYC62_03405 [Alphaproteobacteria bacterium]|nr:MAG: hypothetical protein EYC62_03405 [Alphaproteobacteria bacterium]